MADPITRNADHFVRNHGGIPEIDEDAYFFEMGGLVKNPKRITMQMLKDESIFPRQSTVVTIQCSGTRRIEQIHEYPGDGDELINAPVGWTFPFLQPNFEGGISTRFQSISANSKPVGRRSHRNSTLDGRVT